MPVRRGWPKTPQQVVAELESLPQRQCVGAQGREERFVGPGENGSGMQGALDRVLRGLVADDFQGCVHIVRRGEDGRQVQILAVDDLAPHRVDASPQRRAAPWRQLGDFQEFIRPGQDHVTDEDRPAGAPPCRCFPGVFRVAGGERAVDGRVSAAAVAVVHDVVVDQAEGVEHLQSGCGVYHGLRDAGTAGGLPAEPAQDGADAFAARSQEVPHRTAEVLGPVVGRGQAGLVVEELGEHRIDAGPQGIQVEGLGCHGFSPAVAGPA